MGYRSWCSDQAGQLRRRGSISKGKTFFCYPEHQERLWKQYTVLINV